MSKIFRHGARPHHPRDLNHVFQSDVSIVLHVLVLFHVPLGLFERFNDKRGGGRQHHHLRLMILNGELHRHVEALPVLCSLFAMSLLIFFGESLNGPIFGARELVAPTSPPVT